MSFSTEGSATHKSDQKHVIERNYTFSLLAESPELPALRDNSNVSSPNDLRHGDYSPQTPQTPVKKMAVKKYNSKSQESKIKDS